MDENQTYHLVVKEPFDAYAKADIITEPAAVSSALLNHHDKVLRVHVSK